MKGTVGDAIVCKVDVVDVASKMTSECRTERALASAGRAVEEISASVRNTTVGEERTAEIL